MMVPATPVQDPKLSVAEYDHLCEPPDVGAVPEYRPDELTFSQLGPDALA